MPDDRRGFYGYRGGGFNSRAFCLARHPLYTLRRDGMCWRQYAHTGDHSCRYGKWPR